MATAKASTADSTASLHNPGSHARPLTCMLQLLEEEEDYLYDWVVTCRWPPSVAGNWQGAPSLSGRLRLCARSLFFDADDVRVPVVRIPFTLVDELKACGSGSTAFMLQVGSRGLG